MFFWLLYANFISEVGQTYVLEIIHLTGLFDWFDAFHDE